MPIEPGTKVGAYEVQELLGRGAMGVVYRAYHQHLARQAAVKVLQALAPDAEAGARFRREAQSIAQMRHPNILNVFDYGEVDGVPYMVVEYVPGGSLADRLRNGGRLSDDEALKLLQGIADGLDHAHALGVVHRDVKPANVLLGADGTPILADFGLAKLLQSSTVVSATGVTTGTPAYMSPEQVTGGPVGPTSDRYALATLAYELLTGAVPFAGQGVLEFLYAHVHRDPPAASSRRSELPPAVDAILARGLAKDPEQRWPTCAAMVDALRRALVGEAVTTTVPTQLAATAGGASAPATAPSRFGGLTGTLTGAASSAPEPRPAERKRRRSILVASGLASAAILVVLLLILASAAAARPRAAHPTLDLSATSLDPGDSVVATIQGLPPNQAADLLLDSDPVQLARLRADANGSAQTEVLLPPRLREGDHLLKLCYGGSCPASATLRVAPPRPSPTPTPTVKPVFNPEISVSTVTPKPGGPFRVDGSGFDPARQYTLAVSQGSLVHPLTAQPPATPSNGRWAFTGNLPGNLQPGPATAVACIYTVGSQPRPDECARQQLTIVK